ncbi:hypothetical protein BV372_27690 [Nostoc sp. T09]|uniref:hypothetical protein n=1 Tax=Nostoc sp. T09 TaxID=1932621 RepID=UPI000A3C5A28|nr:hypothetical protein [Nostoc sp. T09]OUL25740.1 hypothetical protein BV372_27690 [Nostoc sp. T09]
MQHESKNLANSHDTLLVFRLHEFLTGLTEAIPARNNDLDAQWNFEITEHFTRPWSERRGIESIDRNAEVVLVKVPLNVLSDALVHLCQI